MKLIPLTQGQSAIVDDWWYDFLMQWKWQAHWVPSTKSYRATRGDKSSGKFRIVYMHRVIMETPEGMDCDHIHHNTLDNREEELRNVTRSQNNMNRRVQSNSSTGIPGVYKHANCSTYRAKLELHGKRVFDETFKTLEEAVAARKSAEEKYFGKFSFSQDDATS